MSADRQTLHAALDRAGVPERFRRYGKKVYLTHDWINLDDLERWKIDQLAMADAALADMTERCRTAEHRASLAAKVTSR